MNKIELIEQHVNYENKIAIQIIKVNCHIIPRVLIRNKIKYEIIEIDPEFIITEYEVGLEKIPCEEFKLDYIKFKNPHPNKDSETDIFCIQEFFKEDYFEIDIDLEILESNFLIHNYDNRYDVYWGRFTYGKTHINQKEFSFKVYNERLTNNEKFVKNYNGWYNYYGQNLLT